MLMIQTKMLTKAVTVALNRLDNNINLNTAVKF